MAPARSSIGRSLATAAAACMAAVAMTAPFGCSAGGEKSAAVFAEAGAAQLSPAQGRELRAAADGRAVFAAMDSGAQERLIIERSAGPAEGRYVQKRLLMQNGVERVIRVQSLQLREDGAVVLVEEINHAEGVEVVFDPPLVVLPAKVEAGAESTGEGRMTVHPIGDRTKIRAKGPTKDSSRCVGAVRVRTSAGEFDAWKLVGTLNADLGPSKVVNETELWLAPGLGLLAERRREKTTVLGVPVRNNSEGWALIEVPAAAGNPAR